MKFITNERYRMPVFFGPSCSPRRGPDNSRFDYASSPRTVATVNFLTEAKFLEDLLPPGFSLVGDPIVSVDHFMLQDVPWLAGRGYNALGVRFPARYKGKKDQAQGPLLLILWENLTDAILTGRDELGYSKLFADLPAPSVFGENREYTASWEGHQFFRMKLSNLHANEPTPSTPNDGILHYRYIPKVNNVGEHDIAQAVLTPSGGFTQTTEEFLKGDGHVEFLPTTWEQMPAQYHIINALAALPQLEFRDATVAKQHGAKELSDVRALR